MAQYNPCPIAATEISIRIQETTTETSIKYNQQEEDSGSALEDQVMKDNPSEQ